MEDLDELDKEYNKKIRTTKEAYSIITDKILRMRNEKRMLDLLADKGFNTSKIRPTISEELLSKENLFPCKDKEDSCEK